MLPPSWKVWISSGAALHPRAKTAQAWSRLWKAPGEATEWPRWEGHPAGVLRENIKEWLGRTGWRNYTTAALYACWCAREIVGSQPLPARDHPQDFGVAIGYNHSFFQPPVHEALANHDLKLLNPAYFLNLATNAVPSLVAMQIQAQGGVLSLSSGFTAGLEAVWHASQAIGDGRWSGALAGAVEEFQPTMLESYRDFMTRPMSGALRSDTGSPCVYSEGAALMWLAAARPPVGAEAAAFWLAGGAVHQSPGRPEIALRHALLEALDSARIAPERIGFVFSAMSGDAVMDRAEEDAMRAVFKQHLPPRCLIKSILGETMHAHGALAVLAATECLREQRLPGTPGLTPWGASLPGVSQAPQSICFALGLILAMDPGDKAAVLVLGGGLDADV